MAKRGETRPWRIRFEWANGIHGTETRGTLADAELFGRVLEHTSDWRDEAITYTIQHRDRPEPERTVTHQPSPEVEE